MGFIGFRAVEEVAWFWLFRRAFGSGGLGAEGFRVQGVGFAGFEGSGVHGVGFGGF